MREDAAGKYNPTLKVNVVLGADASKAVRVLTARRLPNGKVTKPVPVAHPQTSRLRRASLRLMRAAARGALRPDRVHGGHVRSCRRKGFVMAAQGHGEHPHSVSKCETAASKRGLVQAA